MEKLLKQAYNYQKNCQYEQAIELFFKIRENKEYYEKATMEIAKSYKMSNNPIKAIDYFIELLNCNNNNQEAIKELSQTACLSKNYEKAEETLKDLFNKTNKNMFLLELIKIYFDKNDINQAEKYILMSENTDKENLELKILKARLKKNQGYLTKAIEILQQLLALLSNKEDIYIELADIYSLKGEYKQAIEYFEKVADKKQDKFLYLKLIELYCLTNQQEKSEEIARKALSCVPNDKFSQDSMLNEIEILQKKIVLKSKMKRLWVTVTSRCNIRCKTCGLWKNQWDLPYKTAKEVMENYPYMERLVWLGGEVFLYKHFEEMFDEACKWNNLKQQIITNGYVLNEKWMNKIIKAENTELTFSVDGVTKEVYEEIRQGSNFERVISNIRYIFNLKKNLGIKKDIRMNSVIMKTNYKQIYDLLELAHNEGFNQLSLMALHFDSAPNENIFYGDSRDQEALNYVYKAIPVLKERAKKYNVDLDVLLPCGDESFEEVVAKQDNTDTSLKTEQEEKNIEIKEKIKTEEPKDLIVPINRVCCKMPWNYMMICDDGNVLLTGSCVKRIGNIYENSINEIWNSSVAQEYRKLMIEKRFPDDMCRTECTGRW
ncbi:MAG: radical SAM protein [Elusimicrobia bacterium]|nr:radical SAM protein [Elusimicrobiota bacterium]